MSAFEIVQNFARKRANLSQIVSDFDAPRMQNSAGMHNVGLAARKTSAQLFAESSLRLAARLRDVGVRNCAKFRENFLNT